LPTYITTHLGAAGTLCNGHGSIEKSTTMQNKSVYWNLEEAGSRF